METLTLNVPAPVSIVIHRQLDGDGELYAAWQQRVTEAASRWPGFLSRELVPPSADRADWVVIQRFSSMQNAHGWLESPERAALYAEVAGTFSDREEVRLYREEPDPVVSPATVLISSTVLTEDVDAFLAWQRRISRAETLFRGFLAHTIQRPVPGVQNEWVIVLSFDTEKNLKAWTDSAERAALLAEGARFNIDLQVKRARYGFGFWRLDRDNHTVPVIKNNLLVLLVLYPVVFLWGYFVSEPLLDNHGIPFWLSLFVGNLVSTQLLGWFLVPWVFRRFDWWLGHRPGWRAQVLGYAILAVLYAASMAFYAWLLSL